ncbi:MAG: zinc-ribbon domain-containing transport protein [Coriobacteriia bacterium]|nr:zinc-ribbon domain-containing transport protein [Coriobacteriia bacterium]
MDEGFLSSLLKAVEAVAAELGIEGTGAGASTLSPAWAQLGAPPAVLASDPHKGIGALRDADPAFQIDEFLVHVGEMFSAYHEALDKGDLAPVRRFVDEAAYAKLEPAAKASRRADGPRALRVQAIRPITAKHEDGLDLVRIFITAEQPGTDELLCEYWELVRNRGVLTKPGLSITKCPNCGGPVDGLDPTRCAYCGTRLADPALDWVVRKITAQ